MSYLLGHAYGVYEDGTRDKWWEYCITEPNSYFDEAMERWGYVAIVKTVQDFFTDTKYKPCIYKKENLSNELVQAIMEGKELPLRKS